LERRSVCGTEPGEAIGIAGATPLTLLGLLALLALLGGEARASKPRLRLEWVDAAPCRATGQVRAFLNDIELEGTLRSRPASTYRLVVDGKVLLDEPTADTDFLHTDHVPWIVLLIEVSPSYAADLRSLKDGARAFLRALPARSRISVISYAWDVKRVVGFNTPTAALEAVEGLEATATTGEPVLAEALQTGLRALGSAPRFRRLLVVVSDGLDRNPKRDAFRALGDQAREQRSPIFPVAYSPIDERGPLLNLGEIAKRSAGTFRWARRGEDIEEQLVSLSREIGGQRVISFRVPSRCASSQVVQIDGGLLRSNPLRVDPSAGPPAARASHPRRTWAIVGGAVGALLLAVLWAFVLRRPHRRRR
jgi:hypothetical protein